MKLKPNSIFKLWRASGSLFIISLLALGLSGCFFPGVFRIDIAQGNIYTQEMVSRLSPGMTREQVRYVMGSPVIEDTLHPQRWDYLYRLGKSGEDAKVYKLTLFFDGDTYTHHKGTIPPENELP